MPTKSTPTVNEENLNKAITGMQTSLPATTKVLSLDGVEVKTQDVLSQLQTYVAAYVRVRTAEKEREDAVKARGTIAAQSKQTLKDLKGALEYVFGKSSNTLGDFGFAPAKTPVKLTSDELAARAAKAKETREANGTKGKTQKQQADRSSMVVPANGATTATNGVATSGAKAS